VDLLRKTLGFYDFIAHRMEKTADMTDRFMILHLASRWDIKTNLYKDSIERQKNYLKQILKMSDSDPRTYLKREGIVDKVHELYR
jgi:cell division FtsZ-interacting protein ZapD